MAQHYALLSIVFMMAFVMVFDRVHHAGCITRFCSDSLLDADELDQLRKIVTACE
jgi:hypothetical protein